MSLRNKILVGMLFLPSSIAACTPSSDGTGTTEEATTSTTATSTTESPTTTSTTTAPAADTEEVVFPGDGLDLAGTLRLPGVDQAPGIVLIHGSGSNDRNQAVPGQLNMGFGFEIPVLSEIAEALQDAGYAVLTYDKRSCGPFNGCADNGYPPLAEDLTIDVFVADAAAAVAFLRQRPDVDGTRIGVIGHSQGSEFVPVLLDTDPALVVGVMLGAPYRPIDEIIEFQMTSSVELLVGLGMTEDQARQQTGIVALNEMIEGLARVREGSDEAIGGATAQFWTSWFELATKRLEASKQLTQPVLILSGSLDWNVPPEETEAWADHLADSGVTHQTRVLPCITHALNCVSESDPTAIEAEDIGREVDEAVLETIISFLDENA